MRMTPCDCCPRPDCAKELKTGLEETTETMIYLRNRRERRQTDYCLVFYVHAETHIFSSVFLSTSPLPYIILFGWLVFLYILSAHNLSSRVVVYMQNNQWKKYCRFVCRARRWTIINLRPTAVWNAKRERRQSEPSKRNFRKIKRTENERKMPPRMADLCNGESMNE